MNKIFAVVDIQGFNIRKKFVPTEIAIVSSMRSYCFEVSLSKENLDQEDSQSVTYLTKRVHGLKFSAKPKGIKKSEIEAILLSIKRDCETRTKKYFACKSHQTLAFLKNLKIPCFDLNNTDIPAVDQLLVNGNFLCHRHIYRGPTIRCALYKADKLWTYVSCQNHGRVENFGRVDTENGFQHRKIDLPCHSYTNK